MNIGKETETIEFKKSTSEIKEALQSISAILNKHQKGFFFFGVKENGDVTMSVHSHIPVVISEPAAAAVFYPAAVLPAFR